MAELTVLYDGACNLCRASVARVRHMDPGGRIELLDLHDASVPARFPQVNLDEAMRLMQAVDPGGRGYSGVDAWARIGLALPGWKLVAATNSASEKRVCPVTRSALTKNLGPAASGRGGGASCRGIGSSGLGLSRAGAGGIC